ncbi:MAG: SprT-like domain-containing protein [Bacteriovoracaceae bacterium]|jgi:hypothetical protein|nr:SprT-like domain-containing protein [Bacteriovoracaceae bacterium]
MYIYNKTIFLFLEKIKKLTLKIIKEDTDLTALRSRVLFEGTYYPLDFAVFTNKNTLAYYDSENYRFGFNECLVLHPNDNDLKNIIRHELAHFICFIKYGNSIQDHGSEFKQICAKYNFPIESSKSTYELSSKSTSNDEKKLLEKIQKLLKLAESSNANEASLATKKANELLIKYNLEQTHFNDDKNIYVTTLGKAKRKDTKLTTIYEILNCFYVNPILRYSKTGVQIEVCASLINIELAGYIYEFLNNHLDFLWNEHKKTGAKGLKAKNSFFKGIAKGYLDKNKEVKSNLSKDKELILLNLVPKESYQRIYGRLSKTYSSSSIDKESFKKGHSKGKNLTINQAIKNKVKKIFLLG